MDYISKYRRQLAFRSFFCILTPIILFVGIWVVQVEIVGLESYIAYIISAIVGIISVFVATNILVTQSTKPIEVIQDIVGYSSSYNRNSPLPKPEDLKLGRELVVALSLQIYDLASNTKSPESSQSSSTKDTSSKSMLDMVGLPLFGIDDKRTVTVVNRASADYVGIQESEMVGRLLDDILPLSFQSEETLDSWLESISESTVTATRSWDRVRIGSEETEGSKQFDMSVNYSSGNNSGTESMIALYDRTQSYFKDDQDITYVAMAVHELRTPLTIMRGYIEVFEDELGPTLTPELADFMHKMHASSQQLNAFVSNVLNVARIEENQLVLRLRSENWSEILTSAILDLQLRAEVRGKHIELTIQENIPPVGVDRISVHEVINNLVDNAIKYSGNSAKIVIKSSINSDGMVETSIQDFGIGIPESVMPQLFQKFHRSHKSSKQVGGTGLGLYLCKSMVNALGGNIWVRSKEGEGSIFTFTIHTFDQISKEQIDGEDGIIRGAHGWIKNHSLYRN